MINIAMLITAVAVVLPPVNWWLEIGRIVATAVIAFAAAVGGYYLADRGRKRDLLYKERFASFKIISTHLLKIRAEIRSAMSQMLNIRAVTETSKLDTYRTNLESVAEKLTKIIEDDLLNSRELILLSRKLNRNIYQINGDIYDLIPDLRRYASLVEVHIMILSGNKYQNPVDIQKEGSRIHKKLLELIDYVEKTMNEGYADLKLPDYEPYFPRHKIKGPVYFDSTKEKE